MFDYGQNPPIIIRVMALDLRMKNGFRAISFELSDVLDSYFIHGYIIIKYRSSPIRGKINQLLSELWLLISTKNGFRAISFEYIDEFHSYFTHRCIIIKYSSSWLGIKSTDYYQSYGPWSPYEKSFPGNIFWFHRCIGFIFHTQVYNHKIQVMFDYG